MATMIEQMTVQETSHFQSLDELLARVCEKLQITDTQQSQAESAYEAIARSLETPSSPVAPYMPKIYPQGSLRLGTTVKPLERDEFDLDIVCELSLDPRFLPRPPRLIDALYAFFHNEPRYKGKVTRKNRCVRVSYANQFHMDILPGCPDPRSGGTCIVVPDSAAREWKASNPKGYGEWFDSRCAIAIARVLAEAEPIPAKEPTRGKAVLKLVTQLLKRWRDIEYAERLQVAPISIVLTTLAGLHFSGEMSVTDALLGVVGRVVSALPLGGRLVVLNPANHDEDLSEKWGEEPTAYGAFVEGIVDLHSRINELTEPAPLQKTARILGMLFGEEVTTVALSEYGRSLERSYHEGQVKAARHSGILSGAALASGLTLRKHTFHGEN